MSKQGRHYFDRPAVYRIRLQGKLPPNWSDAVAAMTVEVTGEVTGEAMTGAGEMPVTALHGEVADQAALSGLLNEIYGLQMTILSVVRVEDVCGS
jgi:hypothetical protein